MAILLTLMSAITLSEHYKLDDLVPLNYDYDTVKSRKEINTQFLVK